MFSAKSLSEECLRYVPGVARFLKASLSRSLAMDLPFYFRLQYVAMTQFAYSLFSLLFLGYFLGLLHGSDPVFPTYST